jgi:hypothetical protein
MQIVMLVSKVSVTTWEDIFFVAENMNCQQTLFVIKRIVVWAIKNPGY